MVKRKQGPSLEEILDRPFCYYCERDFDSLRILMDHMKARHLRCSRCPRRLNTAGGLRVHMEQVHKEKPEVIENALANRTDPDVEIFGMEGIPEDILNEHKRRIAEAFHKAEHERRVQTGNPPPGQGGGENKRVKREEPGDIKARATALLEQKRAEKAAKAAGLTSENGTPQAGTPEVQMADASQPHQASAHQQSMAPMPYSTPTQGWGEYPQPNNPYGYTGSPMGQSPFPPPAAQAYSPAPQVQYPGHGGPSYGSQNGFPPPPGFGQVAPNYGNGNGNGMGPPPSYGQPHPHYGVGYVPQQSQSPAQPTYSGFNGYGPPQRGAQTSMSPHSGQSTSPQTQAPPPQQQINHLPPPPGLPSRPSFPSPNLTKEQMAAMHGGGTGAPGAVQSIAANRYEKKKAENNRQMISDSVDELIESVTSGASSRNTNGNANGQQQTQAAAANNADTTSGAEANLAAQASQDTTMKDAGTKDKKKKSKLAQKLLVSESESMEEILAGQARYQAVSA